LPAPQSSASTGAAGFVTSISSKSPRGVAVNAVEITSAKFIAVNA